MASWFVAEAERAAADDRAGASAWLTAARRNALEQFTRLGFPTLHDEEWRFTSVAPIADGRFAIARDGAASVTPADLAAAEWIGERTATLVFVNGRFAPTVSDIARLPAGVCVESLAHALARQGAAVEERLTRVADGARHPFTALNTAFLADGAFVSIADRAIVEAPIHLSVLTLGEESPTMAHPRVLIVSGESSQATIVESYHSARADRYFTNGVTEVVAGANATLNHYTVLREAPASFHVGSLYVEAHEDATVACYSATLGGALVRNDVNVLLDGEGSHCTLHGVYVGDGGRLVDNHTTIDHAKPNCASREVYKGILADQARAVFNGKIIVRPDAQKTDAKQTSKALLLSEDAQINTKPQLEIFANDVKCTHGAAVGQMDDEAIFYLRARGLGEREARNMLIRAFTGDVLNQMPLAALRTRLDEELVRRLPGLGA